LPRSASLVSTSGCPRNRRTRNLSRTEPLEIGFPNERGLPASSRVSAATMILWSPQRWATTQPPRAVTDWAPQSVGAAAIALQSCCCNRLSVRACRRHTPRSISGQCDHGQFVQIRGATGIVAASGMPRARARIRRPLLPVAEKMRGWLVTLVADLDGAVGLRATYLTPTATIISQGPSKPDGPSK
jgi:hypothetical protein